MRCWIQLQPFLASVVKAVDLCRWWSLTQIFTILVDYENDYKLFKYILGGKMYSRFVPEECTEGCPKELHPKQFSFKKTMYPRHFLPILDISSQCSVAISLLANKSASVRLLSWLNMPNHYITHSGVSGTPNCSFATIILKLNRLLTTLLKVLPK